MNHNLFQVELIKTNLMLFGKLLLFVTLLTNLFHFIFPAKPL